MHLSTFILVAGASLVVAQDDKGFRFFFPSGSEGVAPEAVLDVKSPTTTVAHIHCPAGTDSNDCGWGPGLEYSVISTTIYQATMVQPDEFTMTFSCNHQTKESSIACDVSIGGPEANMPASSQLTLTGSEISFATAVVAEGEIPKTTGGAGATPTSGTAAPASTGTAPASTGAESSGTPTASGSQPEDTSAAYKYGIEGSALLALAGAAAMNIW
jgi:hypothetical protein